MQASTSLMVPKEHLTRVAGLNQTLKGALNIVGAPLGALLMETAAVARRHAGGRGHGRAGDRASVLCARAAAQRATVRGRTAQKPSIWADMREGLRYIRGWPGLMALIGFGHGFQDRADAGLFIAAAPGERAL